MFALTGFEVADCLRIPWEVTMVSCISNFVDSISGNGNDYLTIRNISYKLNLIYSNTQAF